MPAYVVGQLEIFDEAAYQAYLEGFMPSFERHGGILLATSCQAMVVLEGEWATPRTVVLEFPSARHAQAWYDDPEYVALRQIRQRTARANLVLVDGLPAGSPSE